MASACLQARWRRMPRSARVVQQAVLSCSLRLKARSWPRCHVMPTLTPCRTSLSWENCPLFRADGATFSGFAECKRVVHRITAGIGEFERDLQGGLRGHLHGLQFG